MSLATSTSPGRESHRAARDKSPYDVFPNSQDGFSFEEPAADLAAGKQPTTLRAYDANGVQLSSETSQH